MPTGTATLDFGPTPTDEASVTITGQASILASSHIEAFFMGDTTADNGVDEHEEAGSLCPLVCGSVVAGTGFTIKAHSLAALGTGLFNVRWAWI